MKTWSCFTAVLMAISAYAETIVLHSGGSTAVTTGDHIDEADENGIWTNVVEITGLNIFAKSGGPEQDVNALVGSLGIDSDGPDDESGRFEDGESLTLVFDKDVEITRLDFRYFDSNEVMVVSFEGMFDLSVAFTNLTHKNSDYLDTNITASAGTEITFYVGTTNSVIGLDMMDVEVLEDTGGMMLQLETSNEWIKVSADFNGTETAANYVLESSTNLTSNGWSVVSAGFSADTNWVMPAAHPAAYYRAVGE